MTRDDLAEFFAPILAVKVKRMFGGHGIYAAHGMFALEADGRLYLKTDAENRAAFEALGMRPFVYAKRAGEQAVMSYFSLPDDAYDDEDLRRECVVAALGAARRAEVARLAKATRRTSG